MEFATPLSAAARALCQQSSVSIPLLATNVYCTRFSSLWHTFLNISLFGWRLEPQTPGQLVHHITVATQHTFILQLILINCLSNEYIFIAPSVRKFYLDIHCLELSNFFGHHFKCYLFL